MKCATCQRELTDSERRDRRVRCRRCAGYGHVPIRSSAGGLTAPEEHRLRSRVRELEVRERDLIAKLVEAQDMGAAVAKAREAQIDPIRPRERKQGKLREATALVLASDWHVEERVDPASVDDRNRYDLTISEHRMARFFEAVRYCIEFNRQIFTVRDLVLWLGGDFITNFLHPDNAETNLLTPPRALAYAHAHIAAGIRHVLADSKLERIVVPCNDGNHGRMSDKMRANNRTGMSLETMLYLQLAREFAGEKRLQFQIAKGAQLYLDVYGRTVRFTHGDTVNYYGGVGGVTIPLIKAVARWDTVRRADLTCLGHFHQLISLPDIIVNGSLIGYSPYSMSIGARYEPPSQAFTMLDPVRFKSVSMPLWISERDDDRVTRSS